LPIKIKVYIINSEIKLSLHNKGRWINTDHNKAPSELKKENWKTLESAKKKLKKIRMIDIKY